jgi:hypothetical protein
MHRRQRPAVLLFLGMVALPALFAFRQTNPAAPPVVGRVTDAHGPIAGAQVRWQGGAVGGTSDRDGRFRLFEPGARARRVTASKPGYRIGWADVERTPVVLRLERLPAVDNQDYAWISAHPDSKQPANCGNCHDAIHREWAGSAHARSARNPRLLQLLADPDGKSPPGWDLSREHPLGVGVCATCHTPTMDTDDDVRHTSGVAAQGVHCDYCHKIADAPTDKLGVRFGRDGLVLLRPQSDQLSFGPLPDAVRSGESFAYAPLYKESRVCASCHEGTVFGVHVYGTYSEWLRSPAQAQGIQCQGCHMTPSGHMTNIAPGKGGVERDPVTLASHGFPGGEAKLLRRCVKLDARTEAKASGTHVAVTLHAEHVGHRVPTGFIDRHLLLVVQAFDRTGAALPLLDGPRLPPAAGKWVGAAGYLYAKLLQDDHGKGPLPFWLPGLTMTDTRLSPGIADRRTFLFSPLVARIEVRLWYRRFWQEVADARGWADNDVLLVEQTITPR